jgi:hypothetical protein
MPAAYDCRQSGHRDRSLTITLPLPFRSSRPLAHDNAWLAEPAVALDVVGIDLEVDLHGAWRLRVERAAQRLRWPAPRFAARCGERLVTLMFTAPANQLRTACEANEWALCAALVERDPGHWSSLQESLRAAAHAELRCGGVPRQIDEALALARLVDLAAVEAMAATRDG